MKTFKKYDGISKFIHRTNHFWFVYHKPKNFNEQKYIIFWTNAFRYRSHLWLMQVLLVLTANDT